MVDLNRDYDVNFEKKRFKEHLLQAGFEDWMDKGNIFSKSFQNLKEKEDMKLSICCDICFEKEEVIARYCLFGFGEINVEEKIHDILFETKSSHEILSIISNKINRLVENFDFSFIENLKNA